MKIIINKTGIKPPKLIKQYNRIAFENRKAFKEVMEKICDDNNYSIDWWLSPSSSCSPQNSNIFHYICCIALAKYLVVSGQNISKITVESQALKKILEKYLDCKLFIINVGLLFQIKEKFKNILKYVHYFFGVPFKNLYIWIQAKRTQKYMRPIGIKGITIIDMYLNRDLSSKDHHYPGLFESIQPEKRKELYYLPELVKPKNLYRLFFQMRISDRNYLIKEDQLKLSDYIYAWNYLFRIKSLKCKKYIYKGINISPLIKEELINLDCFESIFRALLNYRFVMRLKESRIKVRLVLDWFENHPGDKGLNIGFRDYYPQTQVIGIQGYPARQFDLGMFPLSSEVKYKVIPQKIAVIGKIWENRVTEFCENVDVIQFPALRFQQVWEERMKYPKSGFYTILMIELFLYHKK